MANSVPGERSAKLMREMYQAWADAQTTTSSCCFCEWTFVGTAGAARLEALAHRQQAHPEACIRKPRSRGKVSVRRLRSASEEEQVKIDAAEANRRRHEREQGEMLAKVERGRRRDALNSEAA